MSKEGGRGQMGLFFVFDFPKPPLQKTALGSLIPPVRKVRTPSPTLRMMAGAGDPTKENTDGVLTLWVHK